MLMLLLISIRYCIKHNVLQEHPEAARKPMALRLNRTRDLWGIYTDGGKANGGRLKLWQYGEFVVVSQMSGMEHS
jgi:hypothetical protein